MPQPPNSLRPLLSPRSIALLGASDDPGRIGGRPLRYLLGAGYDGAIYPVNPNRKVVQGVPAFTDVRQIGRPVDCAIICLPAEQVVAAATECAASGVRSVIVFSAGFSEIGPVGEARQAELTRIGRHSGMRILGPNTVGVVNTANRSYQTFSMAMEEPSPPGGIGMVTQSGGYGSYFLYLARRQGLSFGLWLATGNECDVEVGEVMQALAEDPAITVVMAYIEGVRDARAFIGALETARRLRKPVVILKVGSSAAGASAVASHTAALAGADNVYDAVFQEYGVHRARTPEEFLDVGYAAGRGKLPRSRSVGVITTSGGMGVHAADFLFAAGLDLPPIPADLQARLLEIAPYGAARNPVDTTAQLVNDPAMLTRMMELLLDEGGFEITLTLLAHSAVSPEFATRLLAIMIPLAERYPDKLLAVAMLAPPEALAALRAAGYLVFEDLGRAAIALGALARFAEAFARPPRAPAPELPPSAILPPGGLDEWQARRLLAEAGIAGPREERAADPAGVAQAAARLGFPVVLKILSPDLVHKSDVGGVALALRDAPSVEQAARHMEAEVARQAPDARRDGFIVAEMVAGGVECIVGSILDPTFGPVVMVGLGGLAVEVYGDVVFRLAPVDEAEAQRMIDGIRGIILLQGHRNRPAADLSALVQAIVAVSRLAAASAATISAIEINPLLVMPGQGGVVALDAVITPSPIEPAL